MVGATEFANVAGFGRGDQCATVGAAVVQYVDPAIVVTNHHHRLAADPGRIEIAGIFYLALMADIDPRVSENPIHFEIEQFGIGVDPPMNAIVADQRRKGVCVVSNHVIVRVVVEAIH